MPQQDNSRLHRRLTLNSISNVSRFFLSMVIAFLLTPFIVRTLGDSLYGFWVLIMSFVGYASILEMGVQPAVVKLVGQYRAVDNRAKLHELITAAFVFFMVVGTVAAVLCIAVVPIVVERHVEGLEAHRRSTMLFLVIAIDALVMYVNYLFTGILYGWQRYHLKNVIDVGGRLLNTALIVIFLGRGGLLALVASKLVQDIAVALFSFLAVRHVFPDFELKFAALNRGSFRELMSFGGRVFVSATTTRIATNAQPVIISTVLSAAATTFYAIPVKLIDYARQITWTLTASFMPMFSELDSRNERATLRSIYLSYSRYIFMVMLPIIVLLFVYGVSFIELWIGPEYAERGASVLHLLLLTVLIESCQPLLWRFFVGVGHLNVLVVVSAIGSGLVVVAGILLVKPLGIAGVALSVLLGAVFAQLAYGIQSCRYLHISPVSLFAQVHLRPLLAAIIILGFGRLMSSLVGAGSYLAIASGVISSCLLYVALGWRLALTRKERGALRRIVSSRLPWHRPAPAEERM